jgi:hypothetical protein
MIDREIEAIVTRMKQYFVAGRVFHQAYHDLTFMGYGVCVDGFLLSGVTSNTATEKLAQDEMFAAQCQESLLHYPEFCALQQRYAAIGIESRFYRHEEYHGSWHTFEFVIRSEHQPALERMAQDEIVLKTDAERERMAKDFRTYFLQRYNVDYERYQRELPLVEHSPYLMLNEQT